VTLFKTAAPGEDNFGHPDRIPWMLEYIPEEARVVEVGCGTGWGVTIPLLLQRRNVIGVDLDEESVELGRQQLDRFRLDRNMVQAKDLAELESGYDVAITSELLEHLPDPVLTGMLQVLLDKLRPGGTLLVTVPNGYGWYELEAAIWQRTGLGKLIRRSGIGFLIRHLRAFFVRGATWSEVPNTLSGCPHVQRFTLSTIRSRIESAGFHVVEARGSVLFCGPFSELTFGGSKVVQRLNSLLGRRFPRVSAGFYLAARAPDGPNESALLYSAPEGYSMGAQS
jgi:SAM-dependent methyltransferase